MSFWTTEEFLKRVANAPIKPFDKDRLKSGAYELALGGQAYETSDNSVVQPTVLADGENFVILPGQFALLITDEEITVPDDAIGFISMKAGWKFRGLINVSGFHVDPGYQGKIKFAVFNAGAQRIIIQKGELVFLIWFSTLTTPTVDLYKKRKNGHQGITSEDITRLQGNIVSLPVLSEQVRSLEISKTLLFSIIGGLIAINVVFITIGIFVLNTTWSTMLASQRQASSSAQVCAPGSQPSSGHDGSAVAPDQSQGKAKQRADQKTQSSPGQPTPGTGK